MKQENGPGPKFFQTKLGLFRSYVLLGGLMILINHLNIEAGAYDPFWFRAIAGIPFILIWVASFSLDIVRRRIVPFVNVALAIGVTWLATLMVINHFGAVYASAFLVLTFASILVFETRLSMLLFSLWILVILVPVFVFAVEPQFNLYSLATLTIGILLAGNLAVGTRLLGNERMKRGLDKSNIIQNAALESSRDAILLVDEFGNLKKCNLAFSEMWGVPAAWVRENKLEEVKQQSVSRARYPDRLEANIQGRGTVLANGEVMDVEFKDGRFIEAHWLPLALNSEDIGRIWFFRDITDRKNEESRLKESARSLRINNERLMEFAGNNALVSGDLDAAFTEISRVTADLVDVDTVGIWTFDDAYETMICRKLYQRETDDFLTNISIPVEKYGEYFQEIERNRVLTVTDTRKNPITKDFYEGNYTGRAAALIHAQIRTSGKIVGIISLEKADGPRDWTVEDQAFAASMADLVAVSIEANLHRETQAELENSNAVLQAIFDLSETGIIVEDNEHHVLHYNELYLRIWGMERKFVENAPYEEQIAHCKRQTIDTEGITAGLRRLTERPGMEYAGIIEFIDGKIVERYSKAINMGGKIQGRAWFYLDITERKQKELELINRNFELDSFVYRASHDLKAPLNSIMGLINIIQEEKEGEVILGYVGMMDKSVKKLDVFIKQLTQFSQDARLKIVRQPILFQDMVDDILSDLQYMEHAGRVDIQVQIQQQGDFQSDPVRLGIVFNNIISNAIKYQDLEKEAPFLRINIIADDEFAVCKFIDNGVGIDPTHLEKVFDLFFRASVQATGSGLGLYITHNAIEKLGGEIVVDSKVGEGTNFLLRLPNREDAEA